MTPRDEIAADVLADRDVVECRECGGAGFIDGVGECPYCDGTGVWVAV